MQVYIGVMRENGLHIYQPNPLAQPRLLTQASERSADEAVAEQEVKVTVGHGVVVLAEGPAALPWIYGVKEVFDLGESTC